jgi:hypothetical protein
MQKSLPVFSIFNTRNLTKFFFGEQDKTRFTELPKKNTEEKQFFQNYRRNDGEKESD